MYTDNVNFLYSLIIISLFFVKKLHLIATRWIISDYRRMVEIPLIYKIALIKRCKYSWFYNFIVIAFLTWMFLIDKGKYADSLVSIFQIISFLYIFKFSKNKRISKFLALFTWNKFFIGLTGGLSLVVIYNLHLDFNSNFDICFIILIITNFTYCIDILVIFTVWCVAVLFIFLLKIKNLLESFVKIHFIFINSIVFNNWFWKIIFKLMKIIEKISKLPK